MRSERVSSRGFDIHGVRELEAGDTPRAVSRRHYVRTGDKIIIEKHAEHNAFVLILLDASASEHIGAERIKYDASLDLLRHFCEACMWKGNALQVLAFTTRVELESRIIADTNALEEALTKLADLRPAYSGTDLREALDRALSIAGRPDQPADLVCIISDFFFPEPREPFFRALESLQEMADIVAFVMRDRIDADMPPISGGLRVRDAETGETFWACETSDRDPAAELDRYDVDACVLMTWQTQAEWFESLADFFSTRMLRG
jgi:uncharacterized protein (DUF58 family)